VIFTFPYSRTTIYLGLIAICYIIHTPSQAMMLIDTVVCAILYTYDVRDLQK
jgi:hypothetical protein